MKRTHTQSFTRKIKRGIIRTKFSEFLTNPDGTPKMIIERKSKRCRWMLA